MQDPHKVLGIEPDADSDTARKAFLRKAREWHPDVSTLDPTLAHDMFQRLNAAYIAFKDPQPERIPVQAPVILFSSQTFAVYRKRMKESRQYGVISKRRRRRKTISLSVFGMGR
jgi:curved DNA-binding protein CbpA